MDILYTRIKELRLLRGLSQEELGKKVGYTGRSMVNRVESGKVDIPRDKITAFAKALEVTETYLMGLSELTEEENKLLLAYNELNEEGKEVAVNLIQGLVMGGQYKKHSSSSMVEENA